MTEFYDGNKRPHLYGGWTEEQLNRICYSCEKRFGKHMGYKCPQKYIS